MRCFTFESPHFKGSDSHVWLIAAKWASASSKHSFWGFLDYSSYFTTRECSKSDID